MTKAQADAAAQAFARAERQGRQRKMKFRKIRRYADPDAAAREIVEIRLRAKGKQ
jgi:hypothetical protein